jgi:hypothetical protein
MMENGKLIIDEEKEKLRADYIGEGDGFPDMRR